MRLLAFVAAVSSPLLLGSCMDPMPHTHALEVAVTPSAQQAIAALPVQILVRYGDREGESATRLAVICQPLTSEFRVEYGAAREPPFSVQAWLAPVAARDSPPCSPLDLLLVIDSASTASVNSPRSPLPGEPMAEVFVPKDTESYSIRIPLRVDH